MHIGSVFLKNDNIGSVQLEIIGGAPGILGQTTIDLTDGSLSASVGDYTPVATDEGNGWYRVSVGDTGSATIATPALKIKRVGANGSFYAWGAQVEAADSLGAYIPNHTGTPITSPVLLPQGLTTGRDITGVNLFENVRKQGALNLDGNSWAEVHDNASLDITDAITLEAWFDNTNAYDSNRYLFDKSANATSGFELRLTSQTNAQIIFRNLSPNAVDSAISSTGWVHYIGVYDGSNITTYVNGVQVSSINVTGTISANTDVLTIGGDNNYSPYSLNKPIAQPRIYNRALTAAEIQKNYNAGKNIYTNS